MYFRRGSVRPIRSHPIKTITANVLMLIEFTFGIKYAKQI